MWGAIDRCVSDRVILLAGWLWFLVYAYPGYMSYDSSWQLSQARGIESINEWHPPVMAVMWRYLDDLVAGPILMLVLQSSLFLLGTFVVLRRAISPRKAALLAALLLVVPQNIVVLSVIWKDSQMAGFLIAGIACLFSQRRGWRVTGYVLIFLATAVRYNAAAATFPILVFQFGYGGSLRWWKRVGLACLVWVAMFVASQRVNALFVQQHTYPWPTASAPVDIAGIIRYSPHLDNDQLLRDTPGVPWHKTDKIQIRVRTWYRPEQQFLNVTQEPGQIFDYISTDADRAGITAAWKKLVLAHPLAFLHHRWEVFIATLDCRSGGAGGVFSEFLNPIYEPHLSHKASHSKVQQLWIDAMHWFDDTAMFHVALYFVLALALLGIGWRDRTSSVVLLSGLAYEAGLFLVAPAVDYRYSQWMIACTLLGGILVLAQRLRMRGTRHGSRLE